MKKRIIIIGIIIDCVLLFLIIQTLTKGNYFTSPTSTPIPYSKIDLIPLLINPSRDFASYCCPSFSTQSYSTGNIYSGFPRNNSFENLFGILYDFQERISRLPNSTQIKTLEIVNSGDKKWIDGYSIVVLFNNETDAIKVFEILRFGEDYPGIGDEASYRTSWDNFGGSDAVIFRSCVGIHIFVIDRAEIDSVRFEADRASERMEQAICR